MNEKAGVKNQGLKAREVAAAWLRILSGRAPMLSIEITKECPLQCPGCYAYNPSHLGGKVTLRDLSEFRGPALVEGVMELVRRHRPLHVSLVGGEPLMRRRELDQILPRLSHLGIFTLLVTSAVAPVPMEWMSLRRLRVTVSVDGLPEHHDVRRKPATYERILRNIAGRRVNIHLTITRPMLQSADYLGEYFAFWSARPELDRVWVSTYSPQIGEHNPEMLTRRDREHLLTWLPEWQARFPKVLLTDGILHAFAAPPREPANCVFSRMSINYSADLRSRVEPCILGGEPDCRQCGCAASIGLHALRRSKIFGPLRAGHLLESSMWVGSTFNRLRRSIAPERWQKQKPVSGELVQIQPEPPATSSAG